MINRRNLTPNNVAVKSKKRNDDLDLLHENLITLTQEKNCYLLRTSSLHFFQSVFSNKSEKLQVIDDHSH